MSNQFSFDVFLSHSSKDKKVVRSVAERLRNDGLRVWLDDWEIRPGDSIPARIEDGLERSRVLVLCMSAHAFGSDWAHLEAGTFRFRDPLNKERRFIPLRLDDAPIKGSLAQFLYINWMPEKRWQEYPKLFEACRIPSQQPSSLRLGGAIDDDGRVIFAHNDSVYAVAITPDGESVIADTVQSRLKKIQLDVSGKSVPHEATSRRQAKNTPLIRTLAVTPNGENVISCSSSDVIQVWNARDMRRISEFHRPGTRPPSCVEVSSDGIWVFSGSYDGVVSVWDFRDGKLFRQIFAHTLAVKAIAVAPDGRSVVSASEDGAIRIWDVMSGREEMRLEGHLGAVSSLAITGNGKTVISGSQDKTIRIWDLDSKRCTAILEGHTARIFSLAFINNTALIVSGSSDKTIRVWDFKSGECLRILRGHSKSIRSVRVTPNGRWIVSGSVDGTVRVWPVPREKSEFADADQQYTNAKVLLVGDTSAGKTGLSMRLALNDWKPSDSTVGAWATHWKLPTSFRRWRRARNLALGFWWPS
jgi:WD40 repeat protein